MNKTSIALSIAIACAGFLLGQTISSQAEGKSFSNVFPFMTSTGQLGLFSQNDGKIYIYDSNIKECVFEGRIKELGKAAIKKEETHVDK